MKFLNYYFLMLSICIYTTLETRKTPNQITDERENERAYARAQRIVNRELAAQQAENDRMAAANAELRASTSSVEAGLQELYALMAERGIAIPPRPTQEAQIQTPAIAAVHTQQRTRIAAQQRENRTALQNQNRPGLDDETTTPPTE